MNYTKYVLLTILPLSLFADDQNGIVLVSDTDKTNAMHEEVKNHGNPNITEETHPIVYALVKELTTKAHVAMPRYITTYPAEYNFILQDGLIQTAASKIEAWMDSLLGDLHICYEILADLSYEEVRGILAVAIAEKSVYKPFKIAAAATAGFGATAAALYLLNSYNLNPGRLFFDSDGGLHDLEYLHISVIVALTPAILAATTTANNLQKKIDFKAASITSKEEVIAGIKGLRKIQEEYLKESIISRLTDALKLRDLYNVVFYPVRSFTPEERIQYLEDSTID